MVDIGYELTWAVKSLIPSQGGTGTVYPRKRKFICRVMYDELTREFFAEDYSTGAFYTERIETIDDLKKFATKKTLKE